MGLSSPIAMQVGTVNGSLFSTLWQENILFNDPSDDDQIVHECPKLGEAVRKKIVFDCAGRTGPPGFGTRGLVGTSLLAIQFRF